MDRGSETTLHLTLTQSRTLRPYPCVMLQDQREKLALTLLLTSTLCAAVEQASELTMRPNPNPNPNPKPNPNQTKRVNCRCEGCMCDGFQYIPGMR